MPNSGMLPSVLSGKEQPGELQNGRTPTLWLPHEHSEKADKFPVVTKYDLQGALSRTRPRNRLHRLTLAATVAVATLLILISVCNTWHRRKHVSGVTDRRLSDDGYGVGPDELSIIEDCLELESELGLLQQRATLQLDTDPASRVEGLVSVLHAAAAEHESRRLTSPALDGTPVSHVLPAPVQESTDEPMLRPHSVLPPDYNQVAGAQTAPPIASPTRHGRRGADQALAPEAWLDNIPEIINKSQGQEEAPLAPSAAGETDSRESADSVVAMQPPRDSRNMPDIWSHPHVRYPVLDNDVVIRRISVDSIFISDRAKMAPHFFLLGIKKLFDLKVLDQQAVNTLMSLVEGLIGSVWHYAQRRHRSNRPVFVAEVVAVYFLAFDAIVCTIQLLGDSMDVSSWWKKFIAVFNLDASALLPSISNRVSVVNRRLVRRLVDAIHIYKTGMRPPPGDVIALKNSIFCSPVAPSVFKDRKWDPWRENTESL